MGYERIANRGWEPSNATLWSYLVGVFQGDGYGRVSGAGEVVITGTGEAWCAALLGVCSDLRIRATSRPDHGWWRLGIYGTPALRLCGFKRAGAWHFPENVELWPWLSGLIDTDGSVSCDRRRQRIQVWQVSNGNLDSLAERLTEAGIAWTRVARHRRAVIDESLRIGRDAVAVAAKLSLRHPTKAATVQTILRLAPARRQLRRIA